MRRRRVTKNVERAIYGNVEADLHGWGGFSGRVPAHNAEGVRKFQPRVASTLGNAVVEKLNAEGVR